MSNPSRVTLKLAAAVANGIAQSQKPLAAGTLTLNGTLVTGGVATLDVARRVLVASDGSDAGIVFTVNGTDRNGNTQSSPVTGLNGSSNYTALDFLTVTSIAVSAATAGNITAGTNGVGSSDWVSDNFLAPYWALAVACTGPNTTTYTVEHTYDDVTTTTNVLMENWSLLPNSTIPPTVWSNPVIQNATGSQEFRYQDWPILYHRLTINSGTDQIAMYSVQAGIGSP